MKYGVLVYYSYSVLYNLAGILILHNIIVRIPQGITHKLTILRQNPLPLTHQGGEQKYNYIRIKRLWPETVPLIHLPYHVTWLSQCTYSIYTKLLTNILPGAKLSSTLCLVLGLSTPPSWFPSISTRKPEIFTSLWTEPGSHPRVTLILN